MLARALITMIFSTAIVSVALGESKSDSKSTYSSTQTFTNGVYQNQFGYKLEISGNRIFYTGQWQGAAVENKEFPLVLNSDDTFAFGANNCRFKIDAIDCIRQSDNRKWNFVLVNLQAAPARISSGNCIIGEPNSPACVKIREDKATKDKADSDAALAAAAASAKAAADAKVKADSDAALAAAAASAKAAADAKAKADADVAAIKAAADAQIAKAKATADIEISKMKQAAEAEKVKVAQIEVAKAQAQNASLVEAVANAKSTTVVVSDPVKLSALVVTSENAAAVNKKIADLSAQIDVLTKVVVEQKELAKAAAPDEKPTIQKAIDAVNAQVEELEKQYSSINQNFSNYLTSIKPNDKNLYLSARKASEIYPKIPFYIPGTSETGEFWVEPVVTDKGELRFQFKFIDNQATVDKIRGQIDMNLAEMEDTQKALFKLHSWSEVAHQQKLRKNYEKRVTCFPSAECPADGDRLDGKSSTEIRFNVYEDGSTAGRIQRNKGRFIEGYNVSIDSAMLLQAYLNHVIKEAKAEYQSGTQDKKALDQLFQ